MEQVIKKRFLSINEVENRLFSATSKAGKDYYTVIKNGMGLINPDEICFFRVILLPRVFVNNYEGKQISNHSMLVVAMEFNTETGAWRESNRQMNLRISERDAKFLTDIVKINIGDRIQLTGKAGFNEHRGAIIYREWKLSQQNRENSRANSEDKIKYGNGEFVI